MHKSYVVDRLISLAHKSDNEADKEALNIAIALVRKEIENEKKAS